MTEAVHTGATAAPEAQAPALRLQRKCACGQHTPGGGACEDCRKKREGRLQRSATGAARMGDAPPIVHDVLRSPGQSLDPAARDFMESRLGHDFSRVRVHSDARAAASARAVDALAYTVGSNIVFGDRQYRPADASGQRLLAHELVHVIQQEGAGDGAGSALTVGSVNDSAERQAEAAAGSALAAEPVSGVAPVGRCVQRLPWEATPSEGTLPYRESTELLKCIDIMGDENTDHCHQVVLGEEPGAWPRQREDCETLKAVQVHLKRRRLGSFRKGRVDYAKAEARIAAKIEEACKKPPVPEGPEEGPTVSIPGRSKPSSRESTIPNPLDKLHGTLKLGTLSLVSKLPEMVEALIETPLDPVGIRQLEISLQGSTGGTFTFQLALEGLKTRSQLEGSFEAPDKAGSVEASVESKSEDCKVKVREKLRMDLKQAGDALNKAVEEYQKWNPMEPPVDTSPPKTEMDYLKAIAEKVGSVFKLAIDARKKCEKVPRFSGSLEGKFNQSLPEPFEQFHEHTIFLWLKAHF